MPSVFFYTLIFSFTSGIFLRSFFNLGLPSVCALLLLDLVLVLWWRRNSAARSATALLVIIVGLMGCAGGMLRLEMASVLRPDSELVALVGAEATLTGQVVREPEVREVATHLSVRVGADIVLVKTDRHSAIGYGDTITITGILKSPKSFATDLGRTFDYPGYLAARGVMYTMSPGVIRLVDTTTGNPLLRQLFIGKAAFITALQSVLPEPHVGLGVGLLLGVKQALGDELETSFRRAGIIHIVVLSGYNIMIIVTFVMFVLTRFLPLRARVAAGVIIIALFALLVGLGASVVRASIMATLVLLAAGLGRRYNVTRALFFAGAVMLLINPLLLVYDIGFQLSFMATLGLLMVAPQFEAVLVQLPNTMGVREFLLATLATQIAVLPLLLYHIGEFSLIALIVNILVLPLVPGAMLLTFITGLVALISTGLALPFAYAAYATLAYIITVATWCAALPFASVVVPPFPFLVVLLAYVGLGYVLYRRTHVQTMISTLEPDPLADWIIVEESAVVAAGHSSGREIQQNGRGIYPRPPV